jgi:(p)ppGpp synthase/HD superfamily hydrolase
MTAVLDAHSFAILAHAGQLDKSGQPYIRHLERVANATVIRAGHARTVDRIDLDQTKVVQAALLHDVLEDTPRTPTDLRAAGFPQSVVETVLVLTKPQEPISYITPI